MHFGIYEYKSKYAEWWHIDIKSDSTFVLQDYTAHRLDSITYTIEHMSGRWKMKGSKLYLYEPYDPNLDSTYNYKLFYNNKWKYRNEKIYSKGPEIVKLHFTKIK
jgi:hypothetical protein